MLNSLVELIYALLNRSITLSVECVGSGLIKLWCLVDRRTSLCDLSLLNVVVITDIKDQYCYRGHRGRASSPCLRWGKNSHLAQSEDVIQSDGTRSGLFWRSTQEAYRSWRKDRMNQGWIKNLGLYYIYIMQRPWSHCHLARNVFTRNQFVFSLLSFAQANLKDSNQGDKYITLTEITVAIIFLLQNGETRYMVFT